MIDFRISTDSQLTTCIITCSYGIHVYRRLYTTWCLCTCNSVCTCIYICIWYLQYMYMYMYMYMVLTVHVHVIVYVHVHVHVYGIYSTCTCNSVYTCTCISRYLHVLVYCVHINFIFIIKYFYIPHNIQLMEVQKLLKIRYMKLLREVSNAFGSHYVLISVPCRQNQGFCVFVLIVNHIYWETRNFSTSNELHLYMYMY